MRAYYRHKPGPPDAWGELSPFKKWEDVTIPLHINYTERRARWILPETMTIYSPDWKTSATLQLGWLGKKPGAYASTGNLDKHGRGGHNWYMTTRFDVRVNHPDGYVYYGWLITGGYNCIFRMRRTAEKWIVEGDEQERRAARITQNPRSKIWIVKDAKGRRKHVAKIIGNELVIAGTARKLMPTYIHTMTARAFAA